MARLTIFAGINGAGKTTLYNFLADTQQVGSLGKRVCPDEILQNFKGDWRDDFDKYRSGRIALSNIKGYIENKRSFNWELTVISPTILRYIKKAKEQGFSVNINFIGVGSVEQSLERIKKRIKKGGHGVEKKLVEMRFNKQFRNFSQVFEVADGIVFYDNADNMKIVGSYLAKELFISEDAPEWTKEIKEEYLIFSKGTREIQETNLIFAGPTFNLYQRSTRQFVPQEEDKTGEDDRKTSK